MIVACIKWSSIDGGDDERFTGVSPADQAALEVALQLGEQLHLDVMAVSAGPAGADRILRDALACGASTAVRLDLPAATESRDVGAALAHVADAATVVVCGDHSLDRGSGSVPAYIAHHRRVAQALGLVSLDVATSGADGLRAVRRLDGGRREVVRIPTPCVVSVETSVATLRRASLRRALAVDTAVIDVRHVAVVPRSTGASVVLPFRPRARALSAPTGDDSLDRIRQLTDAGAAPARGETVDLPPRQAAERIALALRDWGYLTE